MYTMKEKMDGKFQQRKGTFKKSIKWKLQNRKKILILRADKLNNKLDTALEGISELKHR